MEKAKKSKIPKWLKYKKKRNEKSPVWFLDCRGTDFSPSSSFWQKKINAKIGQILHEIHSPDWKEPVLIKCHVGERKCCTRILPQFCLSTVQHFRRLGMDKIASGDTTVAYSGDRGFNENSDTCPRYLTLAKRHGWTEKGPLRTPFVVLDRPKTSIEETYKFEDEEVRINPTNSKYFREVYFSGGFASAGSIINHVHLTLHDMARVACAIKGITMGGSSHKGKLIMHQCYSPVIEEKSCKRCGLCALKCPEKALKWTNGKIPRLDRDKCIGCGECMAVCHGQNISMSSYGIEDWLKGSESLPYRMADYVMGMMEGRWERLLNIVHMYYITRRCDCLDETQTPILPPIGFLVGRNPFAVDLMATYLLQEEIHHQVREGKLKADKDKVETEMLGLFFNQYNVFKPYSHIQNEYDIVVEPNPIHIKLI